MTVNPERYPVSLRRRLPLYPTKRCPRCRKVYGPRVRLQRGRWLGLEPLVTYRPRVYCSERCYHLRESALTETDFRVQRALTELGRL